MSPASTAFVRSIRGEAGKLLCLLLVTLLVCGPGCSAKPEVSGFAVGNVRVISQGEVLEVRIPVDDSGYRLWKIESFNSLYLNVLHGPQPELHGGKTYLVSRAKAITPGVTELIFSETNPDDGQSASVQSYRIRILPP